MRSAVPVPGWRRNRTGAASGWPPKASAGRRRSLWPSCCGAAPSGAWQEKVQSTPTPQWDCGIHVSPHAHSGVAEFMSAHSKPPYITPSMDFYSGEGGVRGRRGRRGQQQGLPCLDRNPEALPVLSVSCSFTLDTSSGVSSLLSLGAPCRFSSRSLR